MSGARDSGEDGSSDNSLYSHKEFIKAPPYTDP